MASNFDMENQDFRQELICCVCQDHFKDPVTLVCGHSICRECLLGVFRAANGNGDGDRPYSNVDCPGCRRTYQMTEHMIKKMSVNLTLRNIISALKGKSEPTLCETHNKHHFIFCFTCNTAKCLSCFLNCAKESHDTKEMDDVSKEMRTQVRGMLDAQDDLVETVKLSCQGQTSAIYQIKSASKALRKLTTPLELAQSTALATNVVAINSKRDRLRELVQSSDATLVASRDEIALIALPDLSNSQLTRLHTACHNLTNDLTLRMQQLEDLMKEIGVDPSMPTPAQSLDEAPSENTVDSDSFQSLSPQQSSISLAGSERGMDNAVMRVEYDALYVHSISAAPYFTVCTDNGYFYNNSESTWFLYSCDVRAVSLIPNTGKVLAIVDGLLEIHRVSDLSEHSDPVYSIPTPSMEKPCHFECLGVTSGDEKYYVVSDTNNVCIHLWHSGQRGWCDAVQLTNYAMHDAPSFKLCVYEEEIFVTFYHQGMVLCIDLNGVLLWNTFTVIKPNGIVVSDRGVFVCETGDEKCIQILNHDGSHRQAILSGYFQRPWDVAILDGTLAVLERSHRYHSRSAPTYVSLVQLDELFLG